MRNNKAPVMWCKDWKIHTLLKVVDRVFPPGDGSKPNDEKFARKLFSVMDKSIWTHFVVIVALTLAYCFALRKCEFTATKDYDPPLITNVIYSITQRGNKCLKYIIPKSKKNKTYGLRPEILESLCSCPFLCIYHTMNFYLKLREKMIHLVNPKFRKYLFLYTKPIKVTNPSNNRYKWSYKKIGDTRAWKY